MPGAAHRSRSGDLGGHFGDLLLQSLDMANLPAEQEAMVGAHPSEQRFLQLRDLSAHLRRDAGG